MFQKIRDRIRVLESYLWGVKLQTYESTLNGRLELWLINNTKVLNSPHANQSFDSVHRIFQKVFTRIRIRNRKPGDILLLGLACGSVPAILFDEYQMDCRLTAVDHDPLMLQIAQEHFGLERFSGKMEVVIDDAAAFAASCKRTFDLIIVDLFHDDTVPEAFTDPVFLRDISALLNKKGLLVFNMITQSDTQQARFDRLHRFVSHAEVIRANGTNSIIVHQKV
jgi:spermidine synthase